MHLCATLSKAVEAVLIARRTSPAEPHTERRTARARAVTPPEPPTGNEIRLVTRTRQRGTRSSNCSPTVHPCRGRPAARPGPAGAPPIRRRRQHSMNCWPTLAAKASPTHTRHTCASDGNDGCTDLPDCTLKSATKASAAACRPLRRHLRPLRPISGGIRRRLSAWSTPIPPKRSLNGSGPIRRISRPKTSASSTIRRRSTALGALAGNVHDFADMMHKLRGDDLYSGLPPLSQPT